MPAATTNPPAPSPARLSSPSRLPSPSPSASPSPHKRPTTNVPLPSLFPFLLTLLLLLAILPRAAAKADLATEVAGINDALGIPLFSATTALWDDTDTAVAERLGWPRESGTRFVSSFRRYANGRLKVLGVPAWSLTLYGQDGHPSSLSMIFLNQGDHPAFQDKDNFNRSGDLNRDIAKEFQKALESEAKALNTRLEELFGKSVKANFGQGAAMRETVRRWDWRGHAILLSLADGEFVSLRVLPPALADLGGRPADTKRDAEVRVELAKRVQTLPNGDVLITDIPMVDQGPKGYCVPATWERYLRYMGIEADMYALAMAGDTRPGGGTSIDAITDGARTLVRRHHRKLQGASSSLSIRSVSKYIDRGLPLIWAMFVDPGLNREITTRSKARTTVTDWKGWTANLEPIRKAAKKFKPQEFGHVCLIIGYNPDTEELAISDSWGPDFALRWITIEEAEAITQGDLMLISW